MKKEKSPTPYQNDELMLSLEREHGLLTNVHGQPSPQMEHVTIVGKPSVRQDQTCTKSDIDGP
jgi:hypothetical protein